jgi:hypothetical protein
MMLAHFGTAYADYKSRTNRLLPRSNASAGFVKIAHDSI